MKDKTPHYTLEQFNLLLDGRATMEEAQRMREHIADCSGCRSAFDRLADVDALLHKLPILETRPDFTRLLMDRILLPPKSSFAFRLLEKLPYLFGLLIVLGTMVVAFAVTGVFDTPQFDQTKTVAGGMADRAGEILATAMGTFNSWLVQYVPFAFGKGSMSVAFFAVAIVVMLAAVDKFVGRRLLQK